MVACAYKMRWSIDRRGSPKTPIPKVVVQTIVIAQMNVAAAVKNGGSRAAIQTIRGHRGAMARSRDHVRFGIRIRDEHKTVTTASASIPSANSRLVGNSRTREAHP